MIQYYFTIVQNLSIKQSASPFSQSYKFSATGTQNLQPVGKYLKYLERIPNLNVENLQDVSENHSQNYPEDLNVIIDT